MSRPTPILRLHRDQILNGELSGSPVGGKAARKRYPGAAAVTPAVTPRQTPAKKTARKGLPSGQVEQGGFTSGRRRTPKGPAPTGGPGGRLHRNNTTRREMGCRKLNRTWTHRRNQ